MTQALEISAPLPWLSAPVVDNLLTLCKPFVAHTPCGNHLVLWSSGVKADMYTGAGEAQGCPGGEAATAAAAGGLDCSTPCPL